MTTTPQVITELDVLLAVLAERREFVLYTAKNLTDDQARATPTVSSLSIGGLIKHLAATELGWSAFMREGKSALAGDVDWSQVDFEDPDGVPDELFAARDAEFTLLPGETLAGVIEEYRRAAAATERIARELPGLDLAHELPEAPWFEQGTQWPARRVLAHLIGETAHHAGHADIIRETLDGQRTMA